MTLNSFSSTFFLFCGKLFDLFTTSSKIYEIKWYKFSVYQFCYVYLNSSCNLHRWRLEQYCSGCHHHHSRIQVTAWSSSWLRTARACRHSRPRTPPPAALQCRPSCWWGLPGTPASLHLGQRPGPRCTQPRSCWWWSAPGTFFLLKTSLGTSYHAQEFHSAVCSNGLRLCPARLTSFHT